jgi:hypothetical protein
LKINAQKSINLLIHCIYKNYIDDKLL